MAVTLAVLGILAVVAVFFALVRVRQPAVLVGFFMFPGWLTSELAPFVLISQIVVTAILVALGALGETSGVVGLVAMVISWIGLVLVMQVNSRTPAVFGAAFSDTLGPDCVDRLPADRVTGLRSPSRSRHLVRPFKFGHPEVEVLRDIDYGPAGRRNQLDVHRPRSDRGGSGPRPVVLQIHGGAWIIGRKDQQGQPLMAHLASRGIPGVAINYRLAPRDRFPAQLVDAKRAVAWIRENPEVHGGDPDRVIVTGGSAGAHLAMLVALTPDRSDMQPGFEAVDTSVVGCVPLYGPPDFRDRHGVRGRFSSMEPMLRWLIMPGPQAEDPDLWELGSPIAQVRPDAPPFLVIQPALDVLVHREENRRFVQELRSVSRAPVVYAELPGAQHAFDVFHSYRCDSAVDAIHLFVELIDAGLLGDQSSRPARNEPT